MTSIQKGGTMRYPRMLIVDDDPYVRNFLTDLTVGKPWRVVICSCGLEAMAHLASETFDVVVMDVYLPDISGVDVFRQTRCKHPDTHFIFMTGWPNLEVPDVKLVVDAMQLGAREFLEKPFDGRSLIEKIEALIRPRYHFPNVLAEKMDQFICENAFRAALKLEDVAATFNISPDYARKLLRKHLDCTFRDVLARHRVAQARTLLETDLSIKEIAFRCGFRGQNAFRDTFYRFEGICPSQFREISAAKQ